MDRYVVYDSPEYSEIINRYCGKRKATFYVIMKVRSSHLNDKFKDVLILINKYYPSYRKLDANVSYTEFISNDDNQWEDLALIENSSYFKNEGDTIRFSIPVYYQIDNELFLFKNTEEGITFYIDVDQNNEEILIISFLPNVFVNTNYFSEYIESDFQRRASNQELAATINRQKLSNFLKQLEIILNSNIYDFGSYIIEEKYLNNYGVNEDAVLSE